MSKLKIGDCIFTKRNSAGGVKLNDCLIVETLGDPLHTRNLGDEVVWVKLKNVWYDPNGAIFVAVGDYQADAPAEEPEWADADYLRELYRLSRSWYEGQNSFFEMVEVIEAWYDIQADQEARQDYLDAQAQQQGGDLQ